MKTKKIGSYAFIAIAIVGVLLFAGCPSTTDDEGGGTVQFSGILYEDGFTSSVTEPLYWNGDNGFTVAGDTTDPHGGTTSFKVDWSSATGWNAVAVNVGSGQTPEGTVDLSGFNVLSFWAKAETASTEIDKFGFGADDEAINTIGKKYEVWLENQAVSTSWAKYIIPLPNPAKLTAVNSLFYASDGANGGTIYLDDIKFENLGSVTLKSLAYTGGDKNVPSQVAAAIGDGDLSAVFAVDGTDIANVKAGNLAAYVNWTSDQSAIATVDASGTITGVSNGSTVITGNLGGKTVTVNVTVNAFTGVIYDDTLHGGFTVGVNSDSDAAIAADSTESVAGTGGTSIKISQTSGTWGGGFVQNEAGIDASSYNKIQFSIDVSTLDAGVDYMEIKFEDVDAGNKNYNLYDLTAVPTVGNWRTYSFFTAMVTGVNFAKFKHLGFWHPKIGGDEGTFTPGTFHVDDIKFISDGIMPTTYTVTYNANNADGGTLSKATDTVNDGQTVSAAPTGITRTGYTLSGWNTQSDGNGDDFVFGTTAVTDNITLYAKWTMAVVDSVDNRYYFLGDAAGVGTPEIESSGMTHFGGYDNTIGFTTEASGGADGTSGYFKLVGTEAQSWAAGGWGNGPYIDFTGYDTLVFWAKAPGTPAVNKTAATQLKFILTSRHRTSGDIGGPIIARPATGTFTTTWTKYEIPLTEITSDANFMQEAIKEFKYELLGNNHELDLDEVYLKSNGNAPTLDVTAPATLSKAIGENPIADTVLEEIAKLTTVTAGATLSYSITTQSVSGAMSIDSNTGELKVADGTKFVYATNTQLTATVQITAADGVSANDTADIAVTIDITAAPPDAPTAPTASAADVINLYSETYDGTAATQINVTNWNPGWGQATVYSEETIAGNKVNKYSNLNYQGIEITSVDVSGKTKVHFDLWTADETSFIFYLISPGPQQHGVTKNPTLNTWNSYDINLSEYTTGNASLDLTDLFQIKIEGSGGKTVYIDNIYFY